MPRSWRSGDTREQLKARTFAPLPVRERLIPKPGSSSKLRRLGIPTAMDRLVQASLVLVLEPIFEADFKPVSYGFRPERRAQDAIAEIHAFGSRNYHWVFEADIAACFDELAHSAIMDRVRRRIADKRVLALIKAFLKAGVMSADGAVRESDTGTPQGGIASPLLANIALSVLDEHFCAKWDAHGIRGGETAHRKRGGATYRIVRYADDFVIMVAEPKRTRTRSGTRSRRDRPAGAAPVGGEVPGLPSGRGVRLPRVPHPAAPQEGNQRRQRLHLPIEEGVAFDHGQGAGVDQKRGHHSLADLLGRLNPVLRGWCAYFRHGVSKATFDYLDAFAWRRVTRWLRKRHPGINWRTLPAVPDRQARQPAGRGRDRMFDATSGAGHPLPLAGDNIPTPWTSTATA